MTPRILSAGDRALLVQADDLAGNPGGGGTLRQARLPEIEDLIPAAETVLVRVSRGTDIAEIGDRLLDLLGGTQVDTDQASAGHPLLIPVQLRRPRPGGRRSRPPD